MDVRAVTSDHALAAAAADLVAATVRRRPDAAVMLAVGRSPQGLYAELARRRAEGAFDASQLRVFQLDEYLGLVEDDPRSLLGWLRREALEPLGIPAEHVTPLDPTDPEGFGASVRAAGGLDLCVLGLGPNGHLGFNEPPSAADAPTRRVRLTPESLRSNAVYWGTEDDVPGEAVTAGLDVILAAREILLLVSGAHKRSILEATLHGPVGDDVPSSHLRLANGVTVIADHAALGTAAA